MLYHSFDHRQSESLFAGFVRYLFSEWNQVKLTHEVDFRSSVQVCLERPSLFHPDVVPPLTTSQDHGIWDCVTSCASGRTESSTVQCTKHREGLN